MAKKSMVEREVKRAKLVNKFAAKRASLKAIIEDQSKPMEDRFRASLKLAARVGYRAYATATYKDHAVQLFERPRAGA